jgi:L-amino acid N-acyltransferase YncA
MQRMRAESARRRREENARRSRVVGRRERVAKLGGVWRDTVLTERRSPVVGRD